MKKSLFLAAAALLFFASFQTQAADRNAETQDSKKSTYTKDIVAAPFGKNWEVKAGIGAQVYFGENDRFAKFKDQISPALDLMFTKWCTPSLGLSIGALGYKIHGLNHTYSNGQEFGNYLTHEPYPESTGSFPPYFRQKGYMMDIFLGINVNFCNLIGGFKPERFYNIEALFGGGLALGFDKYKTQVSPSFNLDLINRFRVSPMVDIMLNIRGVLLSDDFDGETANDEEHLSSKIINRTMDGLAGVTVGAAIKFPNKPAKSKSKTSGSAAAGAGTAAAAGAAAVAATASLADNWWAPAVDEETVQAYESKISDLKEDVKVAQATTVKVIEEKKAIEEVAVAATAAAASAEAAVAAANRPFWFHVNFEIDKYFLLKEERINLHAISEIINAHPNAKYHVIGYCDVQTATPEYNLTLSEKRANVVANYLVDKCGVNPDQLIIDHKGGVDFMFYGMPRFSRCVMIMSDNPRPAKADIQD